MRKTRLLLKIQLILCHCVVILYSTFFNANPRPDALVKEQLVEMTGLSPRVIRVWFQNKVSLLLYLIDYVCNSISISQFIHSAVSITRKLINLRFKWSRKRWVELVNWTCLESTIEGILIRGNFNVLFKFKSFIQLLQGVEHEEIKIFLLKGVKV